MSVEDLRKYGKMAVTDPAIGKRAKEIGLQDLKGQAAYAKTLGLTFDEQDFLALAREMSPTGELSEEELTAVAGGAATAVGAAVAGAGVAVATAVTSVTTTTAAGGW